MYDTNNTNWNNYNKQEINEFDTTVLIGYDCPNPLIRVGFPMEDHVMVEFNYDYFQVVALQMNYI